MSGGSCDFCVTERQTLCNIVEFDCIVTVCDGEGSSAELYIGYAVISSTSFFSHKRIQFCHGNIIQTFQLYRFISAIVLQPHKRLSGSALFIIMFQYPIKGTI